MNRTTPDAGGKSQNSTHIVQAVGNAAGVVVCDVGELQPVRTGDVRNAANAELIVRAVNAHDDLVVALEGASLPVWPGKLGSESADGVGTLLANSRGDSWRQLTAAVTKAEGR